MTQSCQTPPIELIFPGLTYPVFIYCLIFYIVSFFVILFWRKNFQSLSSALSDRLKNKEAKAISVIGALYAISTFILYPIASLIPQRRSHIEWFIIWFCVIVLMYVPPLLLAFKRIRKYVIKPRFLKAEIIAAISSTTTYIILLICFSFDLLPGFDINVRIANNYPFSQSCLTFYPIEDLNAVWATPVCVLFTVLLSLIFMWIGKGTRKIFAYYKTRSK